MRMGGREMQGNYQQRNMWPGQNQSMFGMQDRYNRNGSGIREQRSYQNNFQSNRPKRNFNKAESNSNSGSSDDGKENISSNGLIVRIS